MPTLKPWPVLPLRPEGSPDGGETLRMPFATSVVPPERLEPSTGATWAYVRQPELPAPWTWRYIWEGADPP